MARAVESALWPGIQAADVGWREVVGGPVPTPTAQVKVVGPWLVIHELNREFYPRSKGILLALGQLYEKSEHLPAAILMFEAVLEVRPDNRYARQRLKVLKESILPLPPSSKATPFPYNNLRVVEGFSETLPRQNCIQRLNNYCEV